MPKSRIKRCAPPEGRAAKGRGVLHFAHLSERGGLAARLFAAGVAGFGVALAALGAFVFAAGLAGGDAGAG